MTTIDLPSTPEARTRLHSRRTAPAIAPAPLAAASAQPSAVGAAAATVERPSLLQRLASLVGTLLVVTVVAVLSEVGHVIPALPTPAVSHVLVHGVPAVLVGALLLMIRSRPEDDAADDPTADDAVPANAPISLHTPRPATDKALMSQLPALDRAILENLGVELSSQAGALQFAGMFVDMLPQRIGAVGDAFADRDTDAVVVALLSLNVSASMVGARRLEEAASAALDRVDEPGDAAALITQLQGLGVEFQAALGGIIR